MAETVNQQTTDAVSQVNVKTVGEAPAIAISVVYQMLGQAVGLTMQSAASAQQQMQTVSVTATAKITAMITNIPISPS